MASPVIGSAAVLESCTEAALDAALKKGGVIEFPCSTNFVFSQTKIIRTNTTLDAGVQRIVFSQTRANRLFLVETGASLVLRGIELVGGTNIGPAGVAGETSRRGGDGGHGRGGAVMVNRGEFVAERCQFKSNAALGGVGGEGGAGNVFKSSGGDGGSGGAGQGGAVFNLDGAVRLVDCQFFGNQARGEVGGLGGAAATSGLLGIAGDGGSSGWGMGGAVFNSSGGTIEIRRTSMASNGSAGGRSVTTGASGLIATMTGSAGAGVGGALYSEGRIVLADSTIEGNSATGADGAKGPDGARGDRADGLPGQEGNGGGVYSRGGFLAATNVTFHGNQSRGGRGGNGGQRDGFTIGGDGGGGGNANGGALAAYHGAEILLVHCTIAENGVAGGQGGLGGSSTTQADIQGDPGQDGASQGAGLANSESRVTLLNSILGRGTSGGNCFGAMNDQGGNISSDQSAGFSHAASRNATDPKLGPLLSNGAATWTMALECGSPAVDAAMASAQVAADQRGQPRLLPADIGAYEAAATTLSIVRYPDHYSISWTDKGQRYLLEQAPAVNGPWTLQTGETCDGCFCLVAVVGQSGAHYFRLREK